MRRKIRRGGSGEIDGAASTSAAKKATAGADALTPVSTRQTSVSLSHRATRCRRPDVGSDDKRPPPVRQTLHIVVRTPASKTHRYRFRADAW